MNILRASLAKTSVLKLKNINIPILKKLKLKSNKTSEKFNIERINRINLIMLWLISTIICLQGYFLENRVRSLPVI